MTRRWLEVIVAIVAGGAAPSVDAQQPADEAAYRALEVVTALEEGSGCDVSLHGAPRLDELTGRWLVAYSGVGAGTACDDLGEALQRQGIESDVVFYRRPNEDEVTALIGRMRANVRRGFPCQIVMKGEPRFDAETDLWTVFYYGSGEECEQAGAELERQGKALRVAFYRTR